MDNERDRCRAASGENLQGMLKQDKPYVFSMIHKFHREVAPDFPYSARDDIIVISDEAHRTQYGRLALNMRNALPNASYIGFTGTPLFTSDEITRRIFGDYISIYDFKRAVDDAATVPLYYDNRGEKLKLTTTDLNEQIAEKLEAIELDPDQQARLERELAREYHWYADMLAYQKLGRGLTGAAYAAITYGPQLNNYRDLIDEIKDSDTAEAEPLSAEEMSVIEKVAKTFPEDQMVYEAAHRERVWQDTPTGCMISYSLSSELTEI